jgi:pyruvate kinase
MRIPLKRTKIVATVGPASSSEEMIEKLIMAGCNVLRLNFSHGSHEQVAEIISRARAIDKKLGTHTALLADLQGPKIRTGLLETESVELKTGKEVIISTDDGRGTSVKIFTNYKQLPHDVKPSEKILLDDGKIELEVVSSNGKNEVLTKVTFGGVLTAKKGINLPNTRISLPCLTEKDLADLEVALKHDVDWIGLSFVRRPEDINELKAIITSNDKHARVVAKIEKPEALENLDAIISATDAVMIARGDLGVEVPMERVPLLQKEIISKSIVKGRPVIVATQMMESMITGNTPTRAEVNDVANAVMDGADAVMLSGETSVGRHPDKVVEAMCKIVKEVERFEDIYHHEQAPEEVSEERFITDSICFNACRLAKRVSAKAIITMTHSGYTALKVSSQRPRCEIFVFTANKKIMGLMNLVWGVRTFYYDKMVSTDHTIADIKYILKKNQAIAEGDLIINIASMPISEMGMSNMIKLTKV